jgi:NO-binding membrane sensor protein with MHYT domain
MLKVYNCIATEHDLRLVGLAAFVCLLSSFTAINLLRHARKSSGQMRSVWLTVSAISTGFGIRATHFVAMLAFTPGIPSGYNIVLTILSLMAAILLTGAGLAVALIPNWRHGPWIGGAIVPAALPRCITREWRRSRLRAWCSGIPSWLPPPSYSAGRSARWRFRSG